MGAIVRIRDGHGGGLAGTAAAGVVLTEAATSASATYDALAERVQSKLVTVADEGVAREQLEALVVDAVSHVRRMRSSIPPS